MQKKEKKLEEIKRWIKHQFSWDILDWTDTGEYKLVYYTPWDMLPTRQNKYICKYGYVHWMPPMDYFELMWSKKIADLKVDISKKWAKRGNYNKAIEVLKLK